jgi:hypothetical protein
MKTIYNTILVVLLLMVINPVSEAQQPVDRVILFLIDGLHWKAPETLQMPVFNSLIREGTSVQKSYIIIPHHPTVGDYSKFNSCSFPNPMLEEGTIFIKPENKMLQEMVSPKYPTAFLVNSVAYRSVAQGATTSIMDPTISDDQLVARAIEVLKGQNPRFMRIHLQTPGDMGRSVSECSTDKPYYRNIFGKGSPYISSIENADKLLGLLINYLKESGKWEHTILVVTSDHGQSLIGWHTLFDEDSWVTPLVFTGPSIAKNRQLPYFEITDIAPTIAWLLGAKTPNINGGEGKAVHEILENVNADNYQPQTYIKTINKQVKEYNILKAKLLLGADKNGYYLNVFASMENEFLTTEPFYHQDRIIDWYKAGTTEHLIEANEKIIKQIQKELDQ